MLKKLLFILLLLVFIPCSAYALSNNAVKGNIELTKFSPEGKQTKEIYPFIRMDNKARLNFNKKIFYIIDMKQDKLWIVNSEKKTLSVMRVKEFLAIMPSPLVLFQDIKTIEKEHKKNNLKTYFLNAGKSTKIKVVKFNYLNSKYVLYFKNDLNSPYKVEIYFQGYKLRVQLAKVRNVSSRNIIGDFKIPAHCKTLNISIKIR